MYNIEYGGVVLKIKREYPTHQEVEAYLEMLKTMKANRFYILGKGANIEFIECHECNLRNWLRQKKYYFGW